MSGWTRPSTHPFPRVWRRLPGFIIQDLPPEREEEALEHFAQFFLRDEPCCKSVDLINDRQSVEEFVGFLREECVPFHVSLVCIDESTNKFAGVNISRVATAKDSQEEVESFEKLEQVFKGEKILKLMQLLKLMYKKADPYKYFHTNTILDSLALSIDPAYRKHGLGTQMIWARLEMSKELGIPVTKSIFTSNFSQSIAAKVGMDTLAEVRYDEYLNPDGSRILDVTSPHTAAKMMAGPLPKFIPPPPET